MIRFTELLNKVWGLEGFHSFLALRMNRRARLGFGGSTLLVGSSGDQVSFYTTTMCKDRLTATMSVCNFQS